MNRRFASCTAAFLAAAVLSGCSGMFDKEYVSLREYAHPVQESSLNGDKVTVRSFVGLKQALLGFAYSGETNGVIVFDQSYEGDPMDDMASACWQVRTQDALYAYCVENIAYDINKILTINEASIYISYSQYGVNAANIRKVYYSTGIENLIKEAMSERKHRLAVLVNNSSSSADDVSTCVVNVYREHPAMVPCEPISSVTMFSGNGLQRLYEINIGYGMLDEEAGRRVALMNALSPFDELNVSDMSDAEKAFAAYTYLHENCVLSNLPNCNTAYSALIDRAADSEGIAFGYVELCHRLGIDCRIVYGQRHWEDHCWNIVKIDGDYYHVDVSKAQEETSVVDMFLDDAHFWGEYRWDVVSYPKCSGEMQHDLGEKKE